MNVRRVSSCDTGGFVSATRRLGQGEGEGIVDRRPVERRRVENQSRVTQVSIFTLLVLDFLLCSFRLGFIIFPIPHVTWPLGVHAWSHSLSFPNTCPFLFPFSFLFFLRITPTPSAINYSNLPQYEGFNG
jgi:hypothetical protein